MKKLPISLLAMLGLFATLFIACDEEDDGPDIAPPVFTSDPDDTSLEIGATTVLTFEAATPGGYQSSSVGSSDDAIATATITSEPSTSTDSQGTFEVTVTGVAAGEATITLTVTDNQAQSASNDVVIDVMEVVDIQYIGDTIPDIEGLSTLATALEATDLDEALNQEGSFTVFAPNNEAFDALLEALELGSLDEVVTELTSDGVSQLLQAHVIEGDSLGAAELTDGMELTTINDSTITITNDGTNVFVNGAQVVMADIVAGNGVIHVIDSVINLPPVDMEEMANAGSALDTIDDLSSLNAAVDATGLTDDLDNAEQVTIFAPNNDAFQALLDDQGVTDLASLIDALTEEGVAGVLQAHVVADSLGAAEVVASTDSLETLNPNMKLGITTEGDMVYVNGAQVLETDILVGNGVIHVIDSVVNLP